MIRSTPTKNWRRKMRVKEQRKRLTTDKNKSSVRRKFKVGQIPYDVSIPLPSGKSTQLQVSSTSSVTLIYTENTIHVSLFEVLATSPLFGVKSDCAKLPTHGYGRGRLPLPGRSKFARIINSSKKSLHECCARPRERMAFQISYS